MYLQMFMKHLLHSLASQTTFFFFFLGLGRKGWYTYIRGGWKCSRELSRATKIIYTKSVF